VERESLEDPTLLAVLITFISLARLFVGCCNFTLKPTLTPTRQKKTPPATGQGQISSAEHCNKKHWAQLGVWPLRPSESKRQQNKYYKENY
jgi:hypothetical protein